MSFHKNLASPQSVHLSAVFNVDGIGAEMFADRNDVTVFVRPDNYKWEKLFAGVPFDMECRVTGCIGLDRDRLIRPLHNDKEVNPLLFDRSHLPNDFRVVSRETALSRSTCLRSGRMTFSSPRSMERE